MADLHTPDEFVEQVQKDLIQAYKKAARSTDTAGAEIAESTIASVDTAEAAVLTAENSIARAEAALEVSK
jgi:hypothetical protein